MIESQDDLLAEQQIQPFIPNVLISQNVLVVSGQQPLQYLPVDLVLPVFLLVLRGAEELYQVESCFRLGQPLQE